MSHLTELLPLSVYALNHLMLLSCSINSFENPKALFSIWDFILHFPDSSDLQNHREATSKSSLSYRPNLSLAVMSGSFAVSWQLFWKSKAILLKTDINFLSKSDTTRETRTHTLSNM